jgi:hypothetical protein
VTSAVNELDLTAKVLMRDAPLAFARLALGRGVRSAIAEDVEVPALERRVDKVLRVRLAGGEDRVESVVLCLKPGSKQGEPVGRYEERGRLCALSFTFPVVCVWKLDARELRALGPAFLPFVPFTRGATPDAIDHTFEELSRVEPAERREDYQGALVVFAGNAFPETDWWERIPQELVMEKNATMRGFERRAHVDMLGQALRARFGRVARPFVERSNDASTRKCMTIMKLLVTTHDDSQMLAELDRLLPAE